MQFTTPPGGVLTSDGQRLLGTLSVRLLDDGQVSIGPVGEPHHLLVADGPVADGVTIDVVVARLVRDCGTDDSGRPLPTSLASRPDPDDGYLDDEPEPIGDREF